MTGEIVEDQVRSILNEDFFVQQYFLNVIMEMFVMIIARELNLHAW